MGEGDRRRLRIGTRGSTLALVQAHWVAERLGTLGVETEIVVVRTEGDDRAPATPWGEGAFVARIVDALLRGEVDLAVHSAKDVPTDEHPDLVVAAYPPREDPRDALVCRERGQSLGSLPSGARIGTDSPRRRAFLLAQRPDLEVVPLHGNVDTRLAKLERGDADALVLAVAGLARLDRSERIDQLLPTESVAPAPGQGALALQVRASDAEARALVRPLDDAPTRLAVEAERTLLNATGGGCRSPIGAAGHVDGAEVELLSGAQRELSTKPDATIRPAPVAWVRGRGPSDRHTELARRLAARIVAARQRPRALVARPSQQAGPLVHALQEFEIEPVCVPAIAIQATAAGGALDAALVELPSGAHIVVSSVNAAEATIAALARLDLSATDFRWAAVGPTSAGAVHAALGIEPFVPSRGEGAVLATELPLAPGAAVLVPRTDAADETLPAALRERGADVRTAIAYRTQEAPGSSVPLLAAALDDGPIDVLVLTSGSTARGLLGLAAEEVRPRLLQVPVVAIGGPTAATARDLGYEQVLVAPEPSAAALAAFTAQALGLASSPDSSQGVP